MAFRPVLHAEPGGWSERSRADAIFGYGKRLGGYQGADRIISEEARGKTPPIVRPLVHTHPAHCQKGAVHRSHDHDRNRRDGNASGSALLEEIYAFATRPELTTRFSHGYRPTDASGWALTEIIWEL